MTHIMEDYPRGAIRKSSEIVEGMEIFLVMGLSFGQYIITGLVTKSPIKFKRHRQFFSGSSQGEMLVFDVLSTLHDFSGMEYVENYNIDEFNGYNDHFAFFNKKDADDYCVQIKALWESDPDRLAEEQKRRAMDDWIDSMMDRDDIHYDEMDDRA